MTTAFISAVCAIALGTGTLAVPKDTVNVYIVDGKKIENFDGSQLTGRKVTDYTVTRVSGQAKKVHIISTASGKDGGGQTIGEMTISSGSMSGSTASENVTVIIDGEVHEPSDLDRLASGDISSVRIYRAGSEVSSQISRDGKDNVLVIKTKNGLSGTSDAAAPKTVVISKTTVLGGNDGEGIHDEGAKVETYGGHEMVYVLDGTKVSEAEFRKTDVGSIKSIEVKKDAETLSKYGNPGAVMFIKTK